MSGTDVQKDTDTTVEMEASLDDLFADLPDEGDISMADLQGLLDAEPEADTPPKRPMANNKGGATKAKAVKQSGPSGGEGGSGQTGSRAKIADSVDVEAFKETEFGVMTTKDACVALATRFGLATNVVTSTINAWGRKVLYQQVRSYLISAGAHRKQDGSEGTSNTGGTTPIAGNKIVKVKNGQITKEDIMKQMKALQAQLALIPDDMPAPEPEPELIEEELDLSEA